MGLFTTPTPPAPDGANLDPMRLCCAAHELGHALVWQHAGLPVHKIRISGKGSGVSGFVEIGRPRMKDATQARLYQVGLMAGRAAGARWGERHGVRQPGGACSADESAFRWFARHNECVRDLSRGQALAQATRLVRARWSHIQRLAPQLAAEGRISPARLGGW
jgi:hypothetical protein